MAKKKAVRRKPRSEDEPLRICYERIIPDELDPERRVRRALREHLAANMGVRQPSAAALNDASRGAIIITKKWPTGSALRCRFLDGSKKMKTKVEAIAHQWEQHANIKFKFVDAGAAEIRISFFADKGSWSALGTDALNGTFFPLHQPTMNYGWLRDDTADKEYSRVVLHEFGHAMGMPHEHSQPKFSRKWNVAKVMQVFQGPPNFWSAAKIKFNILDKYSPKAASSTKFDPKSIMLYAFDGALFADGLGPTNSNTSLSPTDISFIKSMYP